MAKNTPIKYVKHGQIKNVHQIQENQRTCWFKNLLQKIKYPKYLLHAEEEITYPPLRLVLFNFPLAKWRIISSLIFLFSIFTSTYTLASSGDLFSSYVKVNKTVQDKNGFIWLAGQNGLSRYDSARIINFTSQDTKWNIPFTWIKDVLIDGDNFIVATESQGLWKLNPATGKSHKINITFSTNPGDVPKSISKVILFQGSYYLNIPKKIYKYSTSFQSKKLISESIDISFLEKTTNNLYAAGRGGLYKLDNNHLTLILKDAVHKIISTEQGVLVITSETLHYYGDDGTHKEVPNKKHLIMGTTTNDGHFILLNKSGNIVKLLSFSLLEIKHNYPDTEPLITKEMMLDTSNTLWINSNKGIKQVSPSPIKNHPEVYNTSTNTNEVELFHGSIIVGTFGDGIHTFNNKHPNLSSAITPYLTTLAKKTMDLLAIDENLYIATFDGLWIYNQENKQVQRADFKNNNKLLLKLTKSQNLLYIATNYNGFYIYNLLTKRIVDHINVDQGISNAEIIDIMTLDNHKIWLATSEGIDIYNRYTKSSQHISLPGKSKAISFTVFNNKVYVATKGDGIFILNFHGELLSRVGIGIDFSMISTINKEIWAPAQQGLYRINTTDDTMALVPNTEQYTFTDRPVEHKSNVYIPHYGGMLEVPLTHIKKYNSVIKISETKVSGQAFLVNENINASSENDVITFNLASLDFRSGKPKKFQYKINNGDWNSIYGNQLTLTGLQSGIYKLTIKGTNSLGQWSENQAFTAINVAYLWYLTPQIKILYIFIAFFTVIAIGWLLYFRFKSIRHIHSILSNDIKLHGKIAFNLKRNLTQAQTLLSNDFDSFTADQHHQVSQIVSESLESFSQNDNDIEPNSIKGKSLEVALPYFVNYVHLKYHSNIKLQLDIPESRLSHEMQADIYKIIYETIISTVINSGGSNFEISVQEFKQKIWLTISSDGNDFSKFKNKINFDMSMYFIRQIASKYNASFNVFDRENTGCQLIISIPLMDIH